MVWRRMAAGIMAYVYVMCKLAMWCYCNINQQRKLYWYMYYCIKLNENDSNNDV